MRVWHIALVSAVKNEAQVLNFSLGAESRIITKSKNQGLKSLLLVLYPKGDPERLSIEIRTAVVSTALCRLHTSMYALSVANGGAVCGGKDIWGEATALFFLFSQYY